MKNIKPAKWLSIKWGTCCRHRRLILSINTKLAIKGPTTTPVGGGHRSINVTMRQKFDLYANVRPVRSLPGVQCVCSDVDLTIMRENTEDLYAGIERMVDEDTAESIKRITRKGSERIARYAYDLAQKTGRPRVAIVHKANIMKLSDGLFLKVAQEVGWQYPSITTKDVIVDNACMQLVTKPQQFDVIVTENLYGDILSDLCAGLVGGLGVVPGANIGEKGRDLWKRFTVLLPISQDKTRPTLRRCYNPP